MILFCVCWQRMFDEDVTEVVERGDYGETERLLDEGEDVEVTNIVSV